MSLGPMPHVERVSDADRERVIALLRARFAEGMLSHDTFVRRVDVVLHASNQGELATSVSDLPTQGRVGRGVTQAVAAVSAWTARVEAAWRGARLPPLTLPRDGRDSLRIGRAAACDLTLAEPTVSRYHAELHRVGGAWLLADLGSTNGTRLNGWRLIEPLTVHTGDKVTFGTLSFLVCGA